MLHFSVVHMGRRRYIISDFFGYTTGHGLASIQRNWANPARLLWIAAVLIFWTIMIYQVIDVYHKYFHFTSTTTIKIEHSSHAQFPAITICNINPLRFNKLANINEFEELLKSLKEHGQANHSDHSDWETLGSDHKANEKLTEEQYMKAELTWAMYSVLALNVSESGHQMKDMLLDCTFQGRQCTPLNFTRWQHGYFGNCYTMFIEEGIFPSFVGPQYGLLLTLFTQDHQYIPLLSDKSGFRVVIHPASYVPFPEDQGFNISPGMFTAVSMKLVKISRLPEPFDHVDCGSGVHHDPHLFKYQTMWQQVLEQTTNRSTVHTANYTNPSCMKACYLQYLYEQCNCIDSNIVTPQIVSPQHANACDLSKHDDLHCVTEKTMEINDKSVCEVCLQSCAEEYYNTKITTGYWPRDDYINKMRGIWEDRISSTSGISNISTNTLKTQVAKLTIYFEELNYESIVESKSMDLWDLASQVGGTLGLYGGISFLTMLEFCELVWRLCAVGAKDNRRVEPSTKIENEDKQKIIHDHSSFVTELKTKY